MDTPLQLLLTVTRAFVDWYEAGGPGPYCLWATGGIVFFCTLAALLYRPVCLFQEYLKPGEAENL